MVSVVAVGVSVRFERVLAGSNFVSCAFRMVPGCLEENANE